MNHKFNPCKILVLSVLVGLIGFAVGGCGSSDESSATPSGSEESFEFPDSDGDTEEGISCEPRTNSCLGNAVVQCNSTGDGWIFVKFCEQYEVCVDGHCVIPEEDEPELEVEEVEPEPEPEPEREPELDRVEPDEQLEAVCQEGERRCNGNVVEVCLGNGLGWFAEEFCNPCQTCENAECIDIPDCELDEERDSQDSFDTPEPDPDLGCTPETHPSYCQDQYLWFCNESTGEMEQQNCAAIGAVCAVMDGEPRCIGREGAACVPGDPYGCLPGLECIDYVCASPTACNDVRELQIGEQHDSTFGASDDLGHDPRSCLNRDLFGFDVMYSFELEAHRVLEAELTGGTSSMGVLYILSDCADPRSCPAGVTYLETERHLRFEAPRSGTYYLVVDAPTGGIEYTLRTQLIESSVCITAATIEANTQLRGTTCGAGNNFDPGSSCRYGTLSGGAAGEDVFYELHVGRNQSVHVRLEVFSPNIDGVMYVLDDCNSPECEYGQDSAGPEMTEEVSVASPYTRILYLVVDSKSGCFDYVLTVEYEPHSGCAANPTVPLLIVLGLFAIVAAVLRRVVRAR